MVFERTIVLSSEVARTKDASNKPENFLTRFNVPLILPKDKQCSIALLRIQGSYSWHNIEAQYNNNFIKYSTDGGLTWKNIIFANGVYSYSDLNNAIHDVMKNNGDYTVISSVDTFNINLSFSLTQLKVIIELSGGYQLDLNTQAFSDLLGFNVGILTSATNTGVRLSNITRSVDNLFVHCSIVKDSLVNGSSGDVIFSYSTGTLLRSYSYEFEPSNLAFSPIIGKEINEIRMSLTTPLNEILDLNGIDMNYVLIIREY